VSTPSGDVSPDDGNDAHRRSTGEELEWIGAEVEARPKVMFWISIAVAAVVVIALIVIIYVSLTGTTSGN
jgi:cobalamin biosynthesis Mg chelatase CobN